jgi:hypothetical protein
MACTATRAAERPFASHQATGVARINRMMVVYRQSLKVSSIACQSAGPSPSM